jgi:hypothetical protein
LEKKLISCFTFLPRQPKNFGCHLMVWVCWMAIEILWLPQRGSIEFFQLPILVVTKNS